jgi:hypothetical protein
VEIQLRQSEESTLDKTVHFPDANELRKFSHEDRVLAYSERLSASSPQFGNALRGNGRTRNKNQSQSDMDSEVAFAVW